MSAFTPTDRSTWNEVLIASEIAAIYRRAVGGVKKACQEHTFTPQPWKKSPWRWRRADVLRDLDGPRAWSTPRRRSA